MNPIRIYMILIMTTNVIYESVMYLSTNSPLFIWIFVINNIKEVDGTVIIAKREEQSSCRYY